MRVLYDQETAMKNYVAEAVTEATREARADERLVTIKSLMETTKWSAEEAMNAMKIPLDQQAIYAAQL